MNLNTKYPCLWSKGKANNKIRNKKLWNWIPFSKISPTPTSRNNNNNNNNNNIIIIIILIVGPTT